MTAPLTEEERDRLTAFFDEGAGRFSPKDPYYIRTHHSDSGEDYCRTCGERELVKETARFRRQPKRDRQRAEAPRLAGGYGGEGDSTPFCATCGALLDGSLTNYGCESELDHFMTYGFRVSSDDDRRAMSQVIAGRGWKAWAGRVYRRDYERVSEEQYFTDLHALGRKILEALPAPALPVSPSPTLPPA